LKVESGKWKVENEELRVKNEEIYICKSIQNVYMFANKKIMFYLCKMIRSSYF